MMLGRDINIPLELIFSQQNPQNFTDHPEDYMNELKSYFAEIYAIARDKLKSLAKRQKRDYDTRLTNHKYKVGSFVYKFDVTSNKKLTSPWIVPYVVTKVISSVLYEIRDKRRTEVVHHDRLKPCTAEIPTWAKVENQI